MKLIYPELVEERWEVKKVINLQTRSSIYPFMNMTQDKVSSGKANSFMWVFKEALFNTLAQVF